MPVDGDARCPHCLDTLVELVATSDPAGRESADVYELVCRAVCELASMQRAGLALCDPSADRAVPVGRYGLGREAMDRLCRSLIDTGLARRALTLRSVVVADDPRDAGTPVPRDEGATGRLVCIPVATGRRVLGVIVADRHRRRFELTEDEQRLMLALGPLAALVAGVEAATRHSESARRLADRLELAEAIHHSAIQRLTAVAMVLGSGAALDDGDRERCEAELRGAISDLETSLRRPHGRAGRRRSLKLREELERLRRNDRKLALRWQQGLTLPVSLEPLAQTFISEALRNAALHADPTALELHVYEDDGSFVLEVLNDGVRRPPAGLDVGLRNVALDALRQDGVVQFGSVDGDRWRVRLVLPAGAQPAD